MTKSSKIEDYDFSPMGFLGITRNQKFAILNFLSVIAASNANRKISKTEHAFISFYYKEFGVTGDQYIAYMSIGGREQTIADLKSLSKSNMQDLVYTTTELCICEGDVSDEELTALSNWLDDIGMSIDEWNNYLEHPISY